MSPEQLSRRKAIAALSATAAVVLAGDPLREPEAGFSWPDGKLCRADLFRHRPERRALRRRRRLPAPRCHGGTPARRSVGAQISCRRIQPSRSNLPDTGRRTRRHALEVQMLHGGDLLRFSRKPIFTCRLSGTQCNHRPVDRQGRSYPLRAISICPNRPRPVRVPIHGQVHHRAFDRHRRLRGSHRVGR